MYLPTTSFVASRYWKLPSRERNRERRPPRYESVNTSLHATSLHPQRVRSSSMRGGHEMSFTPSEQQDLSSLPSKAFKASANNPKTRTLGRWMGISSRQAKEETQKSKSHLRQCRPKRNCQHHHHRRQESGNPHRTQGRHPEIPIAGHGLHPRRQRPQRRPKRHRLPLRPSPRHRARASPSSSSNARATPPSSNRRTLGNSESTSSRGSSRRSSDRAGGSSRPSRRNATSKFPYRNTPRPENPAAWGSPAGGTTRKTPSGR